MTTHDLPSNVAGDRDTGRGTPNPPSAPSAGRRDLHGVAVARGWLYGVTFSWPLVATIIAAWLYLT